MKWANTSAQEEEARAQTVVEYLTRVKEAGETEIKALREELKAAKDGIDALKEARERDLTETIQVKLEKKRFKPKETNNRFARDLQSEREKGEFLAESNAVLTHNLQLKEAQITELLESRSLQPETCKADLDSTETSKFAAESQWQTARAALLQEVETLQEANAQFKGDREKYRDVVKALALTNQELNDQQHTISTLESQITLLRSQLQSSNRQPESCLSCQLS